MTDKNTPHECGFGKFCDTQEAMGCVGRDALLRVAKEGPTQMIRAIDISGPEVGICDRWWPIMADEKKIGRVSSAEFSPDFYTNVAVRMVRMTHWDDDTAVQVVTNDGPRDAIVKEKFWI